MVGKLGIAYEKWYICILPKAAVLVMRWVV